MNQRRNRARVLALQRVGSTVPCKQDYWLSWSWCRFLAKRRDEYFRRHPFVGPPRLYPMEIGRIDGFRFIISELPSP